MRLRLFAALFLLLPLNALAQDSSTPTIRAGAQLVVVDVTVTDSHGNPIHNLKQSDFTLQESGTPQVISHFDEHSAPTAADIAKSPQMPKLEPNTYTNFTVTPENAPLNILLLDYLNTPIENQARAREQLVSFLKAMKPGTRLAIFGLNTRLVLLQGFTSDSQMLLSALTGKGNSQTSRLIGDPLGTETVSDLTRRIVGAMGNDPGTMDMVARMQQLEVMQTAQQQRQRALYTLTAMNQLARYLSGLPGRKNLVWFSASFPINILPDSNLEDKQNPFSVMNSAASQFRETTSLLSRAQVAVYPVDSRGLFAETMMTSAISGERNSFNGAARNQDLETFTRQTFDEHATMRQMAEATGGHAYVNTNDLRDAVERAIDAGSNYYTLAYSPTYRKPDGSFRKINVQLVSGNYTLNYRKGYYADLPDPGQKNTPRERAENPTTQPNPPGPPIDSMRAAMQLGAPDPTQIIFKALLIASPAPSGKLAEGNTASTKSKPPYRLVTVAFAVNPGDITMPPRPDTTREVALQFVTLVYDRDGQLFTQQSNPVNVFVKPEGYRQFLREGVRYQQQIAVPIKGEYYLRIGIHDLIGDKVGAIEVPAATIATAPSESARLP